MDTRISKVDSGGSKTYKRDGVGVTAPVLGDGSAVYTQGVSERRGSTTSYFQTDRLGTHKAQTNTSQVINATKTYDAFGNLTGSTGSSGSPFGFAGDFGYQEDGDYSLKLLGHRYYDSSTGRFLTRDPAKDGRNWYGYCGNNPVNGVDYTGRTMYPLLGFTWHGLNQVISRDGVGVANAAILEAVRTGEEIVQAAGTVKYVGPNASVVLNTDGKLVTAWAHNSGGTRTGGMLAGIMLMIDATDTLIQGTGAIVPYRKRIELYEASLTDEDADKAADDWEHPGPGGY